MGTEAPLALVVRRVVLTGLIWGTEDGSFFFPWFIVKQKLQTSRSMSLASLIIAIFNDEWRLLIRLGRLHLCSACWLKQGGDTSSQTIVSRYILVVDCTLSDCIASNCFQVEIPFLFFTRVCILGLHSYLHRHQTGVGSSEGQGVTVTISLQMNVVQLFLIIFQSWSSLSKAILVNLNVTVWIIIWSLFT